MDAFGGLMTLGRVYLLVDKHGGRTEAYVPEMLGFMPRCGLADPPNERRTDDGRQAMGHNVLESRHRCRSRRQLILVP